ncbi:uncharacterized protein LOC123680698 isoform X2 [Harmonia axyridis]|uniref:uncharacterized protein LOC123680698 isoform X2 n=1 Tax=Harmonia axyridis TaxID=115357 RepID=UPI001E2767DE|nr:uncharacterized protein LOC123680698 isoform X2 [Harmonia axyridis]
MEFWNTRKMLAPPTYLYETSVDDIDINHFKTILQDGMNFYNEQNLLNIDIALLTRIVYRMKTKFRNSKDFQGLEKVKKNILIFHEMNISKKLEYLLSILPIYDYQQVIVSLPTKNMIDYILVQLQGIGKILCSVIEQCKLTFILYEHRLYLGHFWKLALIAISLVSRIHILCLNILKFTCLFYLRLLPFSHKLKNVTKNWLPKEYAFPKDLQTWLNVEWTKLEEVIEILDKDFNFTMIDLADDSDDDVEYIEIDEDSKIIEDFRKIMKTRVEKQDFDEPINYHGKNIDVGEEILDDEEVQQISDESGSQVVNEISSVEDQNDETGDIVQDIDIGEEIMPDDESSESLVASSQYTQHEVDFGEIISSDDIQDSSNISASSGKRRNKKNKSSCQVIISSSDDDSCVQFVSKTSSIKNKPFVTTDFIPLGESTPFNHKEKRLKEKKKSKQTVLNKKNLKRKVPAVEPTNKNTAPNKKKRK